MLPLNPRCMVFWLWLYPLPCPPLQHASFQASFVVPPDPDRAEALTYARYRTVGIIPTAQWPRVIHDIKSKAQTAAADLAAEGQEASGPVVYEIAQDGDGEAAGNGGAGGVPSAKRQKMAPPSASAAAKPTKAVASRKEASGAAVTSAKGGKKKKQIKKR